MVIESGPLALFNLADSFEDSGAPDRWHADYGVWQIGVPSGVGPATAHGGSNYLATILSGNYSDDRRSFVTSQPFVLPAANQNPRLRFWHWWSFSHNDYGQVYIATNNGTGWTVLSPRYGQGSPVNYHSDGRWTQAWLDLTPYAGQTVRLGYYFVSDNGSQNGSPVDVSAGWYVDEVTIESGPLAAFNPTDSFEDSTALDRWHADYGIWELASPADPGQAMLMTALIVWPRSCRATIPMTEAVAWSAMSSSSHGGKRIHVYDSGTGGALVMRTSVG